MTAKEYLSRYLVAKREIDILLDRRQQLWDTMTKVTPTLQADRVQGGKTGKTEEIRAMYSDLENEIFERYKKSVLLMIEIEHVICSLKDDNQRHVLEYRYINGMVFEKIAVKMHYSYRQVKRIHKCALDVLECPL